MKRILSLTLALLMLLLCVACNNTEADTSQKSFTLTVVHLDGTQKEFSLTSNSAYLGEALVSEGIISGEDSTYGLYVTTVDSEYHKYEVDGKYWALYIDGAYAPTGVDTTPITDGAKYSFKAE